VDPEPHGVYALYPHRDAAVKVKVLVDFIEDMLPHVASLDRWTPLSDRVTAVPVTDFTETHARKKVQFG